MDKLILHPLKKEIKTLDTILTDTLLPLGSEFDLGGKTLRINQRIGGGLTSEVYQGELITEGSSPIKVAVKAMKVLDFPTARQAFEQESLTLALLKHWEQERGKNDEAILKKLNLVAPKVAPVYYGKGDYNGTPFIVMEYIQGEEIIDILSKKGSLPEFQALLAGWHLYRTLDILHTDLKKTFIDLKFENLWWAPSGDHDAGQLKLTDFGTLEDINLQNMRGIKRDILLAAVYLFTMLTGYTLKYSLGELQERAEPFLKTNKEKLTWGTNQLLHRLLHRNPDQRPQSAKSVADELQTILSYWNGGIQILRNAEERLNVAENRKDSDPERTENLARMARMALDIVPRLGDAYDQERLDMNIRRADNILTQSDFFERSKNLFNGRAYDLALENLEKGLKWSDNPAELRRLAYLCMAGKVVSTNVFDPNKEALIKIVDLLNQGHWIEAAERLDVLKTRLASPGMDALSDDCNFFRQLENAEHLRAAEKFADAASAYRQAMAVLEKLPYKDIIKSEEVGDLLTISQEMEANDRTRGESLRLIEAAKKAIVVNDISSALTNAKEAFTSDRENERLLSELRDLARQALAANAYDAALEFIEIGIHVPKPPEDLLNVLGLVRGLITARRARSIRDRQTFVSALGEVQIKYRDDPVAVSSVKKILDEAEEWAKSAGEAAFLQSLADFHERVLDNPQHAAELRELSDRTKSQQGEDRRIDVDRLLGEVTALYYLNRPERWTEDAERWTAAEFIAKLQDRHKTIEEAKGLLDDAATIAAPITYKQEEINRWHKWLDEVSKSVDKHSVVKEKVRTTQVGILQSRWLEIQNLQGVERESALKDFLSQVYRFLYLIDAADPLVLQMRDQVVQAYDHFGQKGWEDLKTLSNNHMEEITLQFSGAQRAFLNGDLPKAIAELDRLAPLYADANEWKKLKEKIFFTLSWHQWIKDNAQSLQAGKVDPALLASIRQYHRYQIPVIYWQNSPIYQYLKTARSNAVAALKQADLSRRAEFLGVLVNFLNVDWTEHLVHGEAETLQRWDLDRTTKFLKNIAGTANEAGTSAIERHVSKTPRPGNVDEVIGQMTPDIWIPLTYQTARGKESPFQFSFGSLLKLGLPIIAIYACVGTLLMGGICLFNTHACVNLVMPATATATVDSAYVQPTNTPLMMTVVVTATVPANPTPIPTPIPPTPIPYSRSLITHPEAIYPPPPIKRGDVWLLNENNLYTSNGKAIFDPNIWSKSASADPLANKEDFYYTETGNLFVSWIMDQPLYDGLYQLYVIDTMNYSAGEQTFLVTIENVPARPYRGQPTVIFAGNKQQSHDEWLSIGAYDVKTGQHLAVSVSINQRSKEMPFAIDRLLIIKVPDNEHKILDALPQGRVLMGLMDDDRTNYNKPPEKDHWASFTDAPAWNGSYIARADQRQADVTIVWRSLGVLPIGEYQLWAWIPEKNTSVKLAEYALEADGLPILRSAPIQIDQNQSKGWVDLGLWKLENAAAVSVVLTVKPETPGNIGVDAVAIVRKNEITADLLPVNMNTSITSDSSASSITSVFTTFGDRAMILPDAQIPALEP